MGLNPFRQEHHSFGDYAMVVAAIVACVAMVAWALAG